MPSRGIQGRLVIAGATGALGNEVMRLLVGMQSFGEVHVVAREPVKAGLRGVHVWAAQGDSPAQWPPLPAGCAVVMFEPPRLFYDRERALWTPLPDQLPEVASWLRASGATTLAIVMPHTQMRLPDAVKRGLANLDEQAVAGLGFERLLIVRSARKAPEPKHTNPLAVIAHWMLSVGKYMIPTTEQPVRAVKVAQFVAHALELAPPGIHVAAPETVWHAAQGDVRARVAAWLGA